MRASPISILVALLCIFGCSPTSAQVTEEVQATVKKACAADYSTHCSLVIPGGGRVIACIKENFSKLSATCQVALKQAAAQAK